MKLYLLTFYTFLCVVLFQKINAQKLAAIAYVSGINAPIDIKNCGDERLFVAERGGRIRVVNSDGTLRATPFLDITSKISSATEGEEGFLGFAFSPDYKTDGKFYVDYTARPGGQLISVVEEYKVSSADSNVADVSSALTLLTQSQPFTNHKAGNLMFGKDGYLFINFGDGGSGGDPYGNGQNKKTFLAKILRVDVSNSSSAMPYAIPSSNPFFNDTTTGIKKEIWIYGVRNPFRCSVDKLTGDLLIADVGQNKVEEIDFQKANDAGGENYGWNIVEGDSCYNPASGCNKTGITMPVYEYFHNGASAAVIGGYVVRSAQSKSLWGQYIFSDEVLKFVDALTLNNGIVSGNVNHLITAAQATGNPVSFGEDKYGDQYIAFYGNGTIFKLEDTSSTRRPKAYILSADNNNGLYTLQGLEGRNLQYQWYKNDTAIEGATSADYSTSLTGNYTLQVTNTLSFKDTSDAFLLGSKITLVSFAAQKIPNGLVQLNWSTSSELNISNFIIERKKDNETSYTDIDSVKSQAMNLFSNSLINYNFIDSSALGYTKIFYRLKIVYADGSFTFSDVLFITADKTQNGFTIFPNPARGETQLYINEYTQPLIVILYDNSGKRIIVQTITQQHTTLTLPASKGLYILQVSAVNGANKVRKKLLVL